MKLKPQIITHDMADSQVMVSTDSEVFSGVVTNNRTAAFIVELLKNDVTPDEIKQAVYDKFDAPMDVISRDVDNLLEKLLSIGVIEE